MIPTMFVYLRMNSKTIAQVLAGVVLLVSLMGSQPAAALQSGTTFEASVVLNSEPPSPTTEEKYADNAITSTKVNRRGKMESNDGTLSTAPLLRVEYTLAENQSPIVAISSPTQGSTFNQGNTVPFAATADDFENGDVTASLTWASNIDGNIGKGGSFSRSDLSVGVHTITATATDSNGLTGFGSVTITVFANTPVLVGAGDIAYDGSRDEETAKLLETIPGIVFTLGDNVYPSGTLAEFNAYYDPTWGRHKARTLPSVGNHDYDAPGASGYFNYFGTAAGDPSKGYYSYDVGDWHIVVLNTQCAEVGGCGVSSPQGQWLQADLTANPRVCTLAYFHHPLFSSTFTSTYAQDFWTMLYNAEADVILNGHRHNYERFAPQNPNGGAEPSRGIREFVVGTGGTSFSPFNTIAPNSEVRNTGTAGVLKLTLNSTSYDWEFIPVAGKTFTDTGSANCVTTPPPTCYALTLTHVGQGSNPVASPANSTGCATGKYVAGSNINLSGAVPASGWQIGSWTGTNNNASTSSTNTVTMPASAHSARVNYIDVVAPTVLSIVRANTDPTNASSVGFTVTFSETVTGVDAGDFSLTTTGVSGAMVSGVGGSGATRTVAVNTGTGSGTIRLDLIDNDSIKDVSNNPLGGTGAGNGNFTAGETFTIIKDATFSDVPTTHMFWRHVEAFYNAGITVGCSQSPKLYCPDNPVTRGEMAVFIERALGKFAPTPSPSGMFTDVPYPGLEGFTPFIEEFYNDGITVGCSQSPLKYCPQKNVTRGEMAVFIERALGHFAPIPSPSGMFTDVPYPGMGSFTPFIEQFYNDGITVGCSQSPLKYCPQNNVTRGEMAVFIVRAFGIPLP